MARAHVFFLLWTYILFITRPGAHELKFQMQTGGNFQPWVLQIAETALTTFPLDRMPGSLTDSRITDYGVVTVVWNPNARNHDDILVGFLCRFAPFKRSYLQWTKESDVLFAIFLHFLMYLFYSLVPRSVRYQAFEFSWKRPWSFLFSSLTTYSIWPGFIEVVMTLTQTGQSIRDGISGRTHSIHPSLVFWILYVGVPTLVSMISYLFTGPFARPLGHRGALMSLFAYGIILLPNARFTLFNSQLRFGCFGMFCLEAFLHLAFNPYQGMHHLGFEIVLLLLLSLAVYRVQFPNDVMSWKRMFDLTLNTIYI